METPKNIPTIGDGATRIVGSDRHACTVVYVSDSGKTVIVRDDHAERTDNNGMSESQSYIYSPDFAGERTTFRYTKRGWTARGQRLSIGERDEYYDYSF